nr:hypothetical protein [Cytophagales bacterium]
MAALFTVLLGVSAVLLGYFLYDFGQKNFLRETEAAIDTEIDHILFLSKEFNLENIEHYVVQRINESDGTLYFYQDLENQQSFGNLKEMPKKVTRIQEGIIGFYHETNIGDIDFYAAKIHTFRDGARLLIARNIQEIQNTYSMLKLFSALIMFFMLMVILVSFFISNFVVSRINIIGRTANDIMLTGDLSRRISIDTSWDDLSNLAQILNKLLERIETLISGIRDVSDNIAHDLRTPLTRLRNNLENLKKEVSMEAYKVDPILEEADHLLSTFNSLLRITNLEKGTKEKTFTDIDLDNLLSDVIELYDPIAEAKDIRLEYQKAHVPYIQGDRNLIFQCFANLVDNAIKFSEKNQKVLVQLQEDQKIITVQVHDQGVGISKAEKQKVFDRFYRTDKSRHKNGNGLGLSLVKAILDLHAANIELLDNNPGLIVSVSFTLK